MTTTSKKGDWLGRALHNPTPGTSDATDYLGRSVTASDKDYNGQSLVNTPSYPPADWAATTAYALGASARLPNTKEVQTLTATGTPVGNLKLGFDRGDGQGSKPTGNIAQGTISAANIQAALVALPNVDPGDVTVGGTGPWTITFSDELANVAQISADNSGLTGGTYATGTTTQGVTKGAIVKATVAGTSGSTQPTAPGVGATVVDGSVTWTQYK